MARGRQPFPVEYWSHPMFGADGVIGSVVTFLDITERKRSEQARMRLDLQRSNAQKMEALGRLASGIAHDFNNVLTGIMGYAELAQGELPERSAARSDLDEILHGVLRARNLVAQVLAFSRQTEGQPRPLALGSIVTEASGLVRVGLGSAVEVRVDIVDLDERFRASHPELRRGRFARLSVRDTGCGMPPDVLNRIFEPYFTTREASGGTGLGLALVHGIVTDLGGAVTARSEPGHGTEIRVYLPAETDSAVAAQLEAAPEASPRGDESILFVEDEAQVQSLMRRGLEQLGYSVTLCATGAEALARVRSEPTRFDLVITDLTMPGMSGVELARRLRQFGVTTPIILCTGFARESARKAARAVGVQQLVSKPVAARDLARTARRWLDRAATLH